VHIDRNYDNRPGYRPAFLGSTHRIERPRLSAAHEARAARNRQAEAGDDPFELKYQHFSVVLDKKRRLARYTACNVDGRSSRDIDRKTGAVSLRRPSDGEGAEASEQWFGDDRVDPEAQTSQQLYESQEVPGFPNKRTKAFQDRMFQRGHLVRRTDPAWGSDDRALRADADTFHFANCTPQVGFFNTGSAPASTPDSGGGRLWRAVEDYVLDNAVNEQKRVSVFTGPVLDDQNDPKWRQEVVPGFRVPLRFWKVVVWVDSGRLRSLAMLADQEPVIKVMPEAIARGEAFADISKVEDFVVTVTEVERLTGLTFDDAVRAADINGGESRRAARAGRRPNGRARRPITSFEEIGLLPQPGPTARRPFPVS
jgi:endonuclease G